MTKSHPARRPETIEQVHAALERGLVKLSEVQAAVHVDEIGREYAPGAPLAADFPLVVANLTKKAMQMRSTARRT